VPSFDPSSDGLTRD